MEASFSVTHSEYIDKNKSLAEDGAFSGKAILAWQKSTVLESFVEYFSPTHWLDYGCGPATAYKENNHIKKLADKTNSIYTLYDPCHKPYDVFPVRKIFEGVISIDVIEHIPETDTLATLDYIFSVATKWIFLFISTKRDARGFNDESGESTHCTLKTREEWVSIIDQYANKTDMPVVLGTDYEGTFDHQGHNFTYDDWNMPSDLQQLILGKRLTFVNSSSEIADLQSWHLTDSNFNV